MGEVLLSPILPLVVQQGLESVDAGLFKIMSKIGISLLSSYHGAQIFEAIGLGEELISTAFVGTPSRIGGLTFSDVAVTLMTSPRAE